MKLQVSLRKSPEEEDSTKDWRNFTWTEIYGFPDCKTDPKMYLYVIPDDASI